MSRADTLLTMPSIGADRGVTPYLGSLIEVPEVRRSPARSARPRVVRHWQSGRPSDVRPKRRLRREVRIAGSALLALAPIFAACTLGWSGRTARVLACSIAEAGSHAAPGAFDGSVTRRDPSRRSAESDAGFPGIVVLSIEPAVIAPGADTEVPSGLPRLCLARPTAWRIPRMREVDEALAGQTRRFPRNSRTLDRAGGNRSGRRHGGSRGLPRLCPARRQPGGFHA